MTTKDSDLQAIVSQTLEEMKEELGDEFDPSKVNLAEFERRTGISRKRLRKIKADGFVILPHGNLGKRRKKTVLTGYTGVIDDFLRQGVTNASACTDRLREMGYTGSVTQVRTYMEAHLDLVPPKRKLVHRVGKAN